MLVIHCNECQLRLTDQGYNSYLAAEHARRTIGYATGRITRYGEDEVLCRDCYEITQVSM